MVSVTEMMLVSVTEVMMSVPGGQRGEAGLRQPVADGVRAGEAGAPLLGGAPL